MQCNLVLDKHWCCFVAVRLCTSVQCECSDGLTRHASLKLHSFMSLDIEKFDVYDNVRREVLFYFIYKDYL